MYAIIFKPSRKYCEELKEGDDALDAIGNRARVTRVFYRGLGKNGRMSVGYYTSYGTHSEMSTIVTEGKIKRTVRLTGELSSYQLDAIEAELSPMDEVPPNV